MQTINSIQAQPRWVTYAKFCDLTGMTLRTAKYYVSQGRLKIKPRKHQSEIVFIDWWDFSND